MKISLKRKILLICLSLILALATALFATHYFDRTSLALVSPDGLSAYDGDEGDGSDEGDEGNGGETGEAEDDDDDGPAGPGGIAPPDPFDDPDDFDWVTAAQQITLEIGKLVIQVEKWEENGIATKAKFNPNPDGLYSDELVAKIEALLKSEFIEYEYRDVNGNLLTEAEMLELVNKPGVTIFIHVKVNAEYEDSVTITFADGVTTSYAYTTEFPSSEQSKLKPVPPIKPTEYEFDYEGKEINLQSILDEVLKDRDAYLMFVASESDALIQNSAGVYHLTISFRDGAKYYWQGTDYDRSVVTITVTVKPMVLKVEDTFLGEWYYSGYDIDVWEEIEKLFGDHVIVAAGYSAVAKNAGEYSFHIIINPAYSGSIEWAEGIEWAKDADGNDIIGHIEFTWTIKKSIITGVWGEQADYGRITVTSETGYELQASDIEYDYTDVETGEVVASSDLVVGREYYVDVVLKNENLEWSSAPERHKFKLEKQLVELPKPEINVTSVEYTGFDITFVVTINGKPLSDPEFEGLIEVVAELSDSLTQKNVGKYKIVIRLIDDAVAWTGNVTGDVVIEFEITKIVIDVQWNDPDTGTPTFSSSFASEDYSSVVKVEYIDSKGNKVTKSQLVKGETYTAVVTLIDETNFEWKEGAQLEFTFTLNIEFIKLEVPKASEGNYEFTGEKITVTVTNQAQLEEYIKNGYVQIVSGSFEQTNAGTYTVVLKVKNNAYVWAEGDGEYITVSFTIKKAVLSGEWGNDGKIKFTSSFKGNYDDVVEYEYFDSNGNKVAYADLVEGQTYTATVKLKTGMDVNFDDSGILKSFTFTFKSSSSGKSSFPWWIFLIIAAVLIIIIVIIIIIMKRRNKDDEYDDFYGDEYYGDEEGEGGEGDDFGEDYGDDLGEDYGEGEGAY